MITEEGLKKRIEQLEREIQQGIAQLNQQQMALTMKRGALDELRRAYATKSPEVKKEGAEHVEQEPEKAQ